MNTQVQQSDNGEKNRFIGQHFIQAFNNLLSTARIHQDNNRLLIGCVDNFIRISEELLREEDEITLLVSVGGFYLQQEKVIVQRNAAGLVRKMQFFFKQRQIDGLRFHQNITYAPVKDIIAVARILNTCAKKDDPVHWLTTEMAEDQFPWIEVIDPSQTESLDALFADAAAPSTRPARDGSASQSSPTGTGIPSAQNSRNTKSAAPSQPQAPSPGKPGKKVPGSTKQVRTRKAMRTYSYAMNSLHDLSNRLSSDRTAGIGKAMHMVQSMVDQIMEDDNVLIGLSTIRDHDDYTFTHSVNVAILAVCLGNRIGMSRVMLSRLGLSGLFHDLGKIDVPLDILNKPGKLEEHDFVIIQKHSLNSVRRIIGLRASYDKKSSILLPPFEHHLKYDLSGYPKTPRKKPISLLGRIITIADVYDAVTSQRIYRNSYMSPDQALGLMFRESGTTFDPILLKVFINMLGIYPVGTVLKLQNGKIGIVSQPPDEAQHSPELWVRLLEKNNHDDFSKGTMISIGKWHSETGTFDQPIFESCHPSELGIQPAEFLF